MEFNPKKCSVVHFGKKNINLCYEMNGYWIEENKVQKDLGVLISNDLKVAAQCQESVNKANKILGVIKRSVMHKSVEVVSLLYKAYVLPCLEYCMQAWSPYIRKDVEKLERVQRRASKIIPSIRQLNYIDRLRKMKLQTLETRAMRADMILVFRIIKEADEDTISKFFEFDRNNRYRGHKYKIVKKHCNTDIRKNFFSFRVVNFWNEMPECIVDSTSLEIFKSKLSKYFIEKELF